LRGLVLLVIGKTTVYQGFWSITALPINIEI
jgi:hypothetical protein